MTFRRLFTLVATCGLLAACGNETQRLEQSRLSDFGRFGRSIDISGSRAVIGAYQENGGEGAVYVFTRLSDTWSLEARLVSPSPDDEQFGDSVAVSGNTVVVGAPMDDQPGAFRSGSAYVFERASDGTWPLTATLASQGGHQAWEAFGGEVAVDGNLIAVGAVDRDQAGQVDAGGVFVFEKSGGSWSYLQQINAPMPVAQDKFGNAIDIAGTNLVVGAVRRDNGVRQDAGAVFVYTRPAALFSLAQSIQPRDAAANDLFGVSVALEVASGGARRLVIGAEGCDPGGVSNAGAAYVYDSPGAAAFTQTQKLIAGDPAAGAIFGDDVAVAGGRIAVGAPSFNGAAPQSGAAYTFALAGTWTQQQKLERNPSDANATFGTTVAMVGTNLLVGSTNEQIGTLLDYTGSAHAYLEVSGVYQHMHVLTAQGGALAAQAYGQRFSLGGDRLASIGTLQADVFRRDAYGWSLEQHFPAVGNETFSGVAVTSTTIAIAGKRLPAMATVPVGFVKVYARTGDTWTLQQELLPDLVSAAQPQESANSLVVALEGDTLAVGARRWNGGDGRVFVYERAAGVWTQSQLFTSPQQATNFDMNFGNQVRLSGNTLVVCEVPSSGVPMSPQNGNVFIYTRPNGTADFAQQQVLTAPAPAAGDRFGAGVAIDGDLLATYTGAGTMLRVYRRTGGTFNEIWSTPSPDVGGISVFEVGLALHGDRLAVGASSATVESSAGAGEVRVLLRQPDDTYAPDTALRTVPTANLNLGRGVAMDEGRIIANSNNTAGRLYNFEL